MLITTLTKQETVVLTLVAKGWSNARIARELVISIRTVESHLTNIFVKLNVGSRTEAAIYLVRQQGVGVAEIGVNHDNADTRPSLSSLMR